MSTVLIVDDRPIERDFLRTLLGYEGHRILEAGDGNEALDVTRVEHPDLVIVDLLMPTMDGFEFVRRVRNDGSIAGTRVVFYTASYLEAEARELARQCGVEHIITKPAEPEELLRIVRLSLGTPGKTAPAPELERFRDEHLRLISSKLVDRAESLVPQLDALIDLALQMASVRDADRLIEIFCSSARQILGARESIVMVQTNGDTPRIWVSGLEDSDAAKLRPRAGTGRIPELVKAGRTDKGARTTPAELGLPEGFPEFESWTVAPVTSPTQAFGWICVTTKLGGREFTPSDVRLLSILAALAGRIYEGGRLFSLAQNRADALEREITERKNTEQQLRQSQKMEAVGRLAGGVAHDFNNLLTVINGYSAMLAEVVPDGAQKEYVQEILNAGERSAQLTHQLLAFSRKQVLQTEVLVLNSVVSRLDKMVRRLIGEDVKVVERLLPDLWHARLDRGQLEQVVMNLVVNSRDAMPKGGTLTVETGNVRLSEADCAGRPDAAPGEYVYLSIADTGHGMDAATLGRIFEPFFTTKPVGQGTGLGLATVFGIVRQSGGHIRVYSEVGRGSKFTVLFPRIPEGAAAPAPVETGVKAVGSETLLVAEDELPVRELTTLILRGAGYRVLPVGSADEALALSRSFKDPIHLLVTDIVMPGHNGVLLATRLAAERPGLKTLFVSGYTRDALEAHVSAGTRLDLLQKPFTPAVLLDRVRKSLDGNATPGSLST
jgi:two-component system, cell cycle sensor histidine kinase and response regulator CckA